MEPTTIGRFRMGLPWSPFSVALICVLLPPGGAALTVLNVRRLGQIDARQTRSLVTATIVIMAVGMVTMLAVSGMNIRRGPGVYQDAWTVLRIGVASASYLVQRGPYRAWRTAHKAARTGSWIPALGVAVMYTLVWAVVLLPIYFLAEGLLAAGGATSLL